MSGLFIEKLSKHHRVASFDCGTEALNNFLIRHALQSQQSNAAQTYVAVSDGEVVGYHSLAVGEISSVDAPERLIKGLARHPVPVMVLARLAVHSNWQGKGLGAGLLKDAILRTLNAADIAGIRAIIIHAKDEAAAAFYARYDFAAGFADPMQMYMLIKDVKALT